MRRFHTCLLALTSLLLLGGISSAASAQSGGEAIAQGFAIHGTASDFVSGALVSTQSHNAHSVELATRNNASRMAGVVSTQPLVALSSDTTPKVQVVISGGVPALVSDINGAIQAGDKITSSPIAGVGMLATSSDQVVGTAQDDFSTAGADTQRITDADGKTRSVHIGRVALQIGIAYYQAPTSGFIPPLVQGLADNIAGRPVSLIRILVCTILLLLAFVSTAALVYTSVRSGLISIGRNPLAAGAIRRGMIQIGAAAVLILGLVLLGSYIILTV
jgi:hypothetical protein